MMRSVIIAGLLLTAAAGAALADDSKFSDADFNFDHVSCTGAPNQIRIIVTGLEQSVGLVTVELFPNKQDGFLRGRNRLKRIRFAAHAPETKICMDAPEPGLFAIAAYHDQNANMRFDKNAIGLPAEPWGLSNNPKVRLAPPPIEKTLFEVTPENGAHIVIKLN